MPDLASQSEQEFAAQFLDEYYAECDEYLTGVRRNLLALEEGLRAGTGFERERLNELFRSVHTIKGVSGMVGVHLAEEVAHHMESYLRLLTQGRASATEDGADALTEGANALERIIAAHRTKESAPEVSATVARLAALAETKTTPKESHEIEDNGGADDSDVRGMRGTAGGAKELRDEERARLQDALARGLRAVRFEFTPAPALAARGVNVNAMRELLRGLGEMIHAAPRITPDAGIAFDFLVATAEPVESFETLRDDGMIFWPYDETEDAPDEGRDGARAQVGGEVATAAAVSVQSAAGATHARSPELAGSAALAPSNIVRVELPKLDELMRLVGELVVTRARQEDDLGRLEADFPKAAWHALSETNMAMERQLRDLREGVMRVRMVHIGEVFERMRFVVRDLAREHGKSVRVEQTGQQIEIDKFLVERMMEPLLHLVRNSISHGLETARERELAGKPAFGTVALRAATAGERVRIEIEDDGRGIDTNAVESRARTLGLLGAGASLADEKALLELLCTPGFSTRERADRTSGRGVGMDVVRKTVHELGGTLALTTERGRFTRFTIELPLTLAITDALIVAAGGQQFAVPQSSVREVIEVSAAQVTAFEGNEILRYRENVLPLIRLSRFFKLTDGNPKKFFALVVGEGARAVGLAVERVSGLREIVVRAITDEMAQVAGIAGATELGDGRLILILDSAELLRLLEES